MRTKVATVENAFFTSAFFVKQLKVIVQLVYATLVCEWQLHFHHKSSVTENSVSFSIGFAKVGAGRTIFKQ